MNRGALAVISLALGAIVLIVLYHIYKPAINNMADSIFNKISGMLSTESDNVNAILPNLKALV